MSVITIEDLLNNKKKMELESAKTLVLNLKELDGDIEVRKLTFDEFLEIEGDRGDDEIIYNCCINPSFKDEKLVQALGVKENPIEGVEKVLSRKTIKRMTAEILKFSNLLSYDKDLVTVVADEVKN